MNVCQRSEWKNTVFSSTSYKNYKRSSDLIATFPLRHRGLTLTTEERVAYQLNLWEVCGVFPWRLIDPLSACESILGRGGLGIIKSLSRPWVSSQEAVFLCALCFTSCLQVPALIALHDGLWLGHTIWNKPSLLQGAFGSAVLSQRHRSICSRKQTKTGFAFPY